MSPSATSRYGVGGDLIMAIEGQPVDRNDAITRAMARKRPGDRLAMKIFRNGRTQNIRSFLARILEMHYKPHRGSAFCPAVDPVSHCGVGQPGHASVRRCSRR